MFFLVEYDRNRGKIVSLKTFEALNDGDVENVRLEMELDLNRRGIDHEVVVLDAASEEAVRRTHRRYFEDLSELVNSPAR